MPRPFRVHKFNAQRTNGFDSKREAEYAAELERRKRAENGDVADYLRQVPIHLPGTKLVVDFMVIYRNGEVCFVEVKGVETPAWKAKMRALQELRPHIYNRYIVVK